MTQLRRRRRRRKKGKFAGHFPDYTDRYIKGFPLSRYGEAVLGYVLVQTGAREGDDRLIDSGMKALAYVANRPPGTHHRAAVFEDMAMAAAYNFVRRNLPDHPLFKRNQEAWKRFLRKIRPVSIPPSSTVRRWRRAYERWVRLQTRGDP